MILGFSLGLPMLTNHPMGRALTSDWFANGFIMVGYENFLTSGRIFCPKCDKYKFLIENHYKTIYEQESIPVGCVPPALHRDRDLPDRNPWTETTLYIDPLDRCPPRQRPPGRNMGPGSQTGSDITQILPPKPCRQNARHV